mmetsp:Transcript_43644/g.101899  ORF Transcript_43644/g.101899 Transcript_43644/m.101899 type:complete len:247 (-) Transcript_43644:583-1323(-)
MACSKHYALRSRIKPLGRCRARGRREGLFPRQGPWLPQRASLAGYRLPLPRGRPRIGLGEQATTGGPKWLAGHALLVPPAISTRRPMASQGGLPVRRWKDGRWRGGDKQSQKCSPCLPEGRKEDHPRCGAAGNPEGMELRKRLWLHRCGRTVVRRLLPAFRPHRVSEAAVRPRRPRVLRHTARRSSALLAAADAGHRPTTRSRCLRGTPWGSAQRWLHCRSGGQHCSCGGRRGARAVPCAAREAVS